MTEHEHPAPRSGSAASLAPVGVRDVRSPSRGRALVWRWRTWRLHLLRIFVFTSCDRRNGNGVPTTAQLHVTYHGLTQIASLVMQSAQDRGSGRKSDQAGISQPKTEKGRVTPASSNPVEHSPLRARHPPRPRPACRTHTPQRTASIRPGTSPPRRGRE